MLEYTSGSLIEVLNFQYFDVDVATYERIIRIQLNGLTIVENHYDGTPIGQHQLYYSVVVPPHTEVNFGANINGAVKSMFCMVTGRVYGAT